MFRQLTVAAVTTFTNCNITMVEPPVAPDPLPSEVAEPLVARLTDAQFEHTIVDVLGTELTAEERDWLPRTETIPGSYATNITGQNFADDFIIAYARIARSLAARLDTTDLLLEHGGCDTVAPSCLEPFVEQLGMLLARRPLETEEVDLYLDLAAAIQADALTTDIHVVEGVVQAMLQSPQFLYRIENEIDRAPGEVRDLTGWELASRLSFFLWQSAPDTELLTFAAGPNGDGVYDPDALDVQLDRMLADPRFERTRAAFWGDYSLVSTASFSSVTPEVADELRDSMMASFDRYFSEDGDDLPLTALFDGNTLMMTPAVAQIAGVASAGDGILPYDDVPERSGLITHPAFLAAMGTTSFVGRGTFLTERLLCQHTGPPPSDPGTTTRIEDTEQATTGLTPREASQFRFGLEPLCLACHTQFEPIAYGFERFDVSGEYRLTDDQGRALYSDGALPPYGTRPEIPFATAQELLSSLAGESIATRCLVENMMEFGYGARPYHAHALIDHAQATFEYDGTTFDALVRSVATSPRMSLLRAVEP